MAETRVDFATVAERGMVALVSAKAPPGANNREVTMPTVAGPHWRQLVALPKKRAGDFRPAGLNRPFI
jgi:hypothetical protein